MTSPVLPATELCPMLYKFHDARRHHISKVKYRARNWPAYSAGLCRRVDLNLALTGQDWQLASAEARGPRRRVGVFGQCDGPVGRFIADGAYDGDPVYDAVKRHSPDPTPKVVIPPRKTAVISSLSQLNDC